MNVRPRSLALALLAWLTAVAGLEAQTASAGAIVRQGNGRGAPACVTCHGPGLLGDTIQGFPRLAGLSARYVTAQLEAFASGERVSAVMLPVAGALTPSERVALGRYLEGVASPPAPVGPTGGGADAARARAGLDAAMAEAGVALATTGRWSDEIPGCDRCHGPDGVGVGDASPPWRANPPAT